MSLSYLCLNYRYPLKKIHECKEAAENTLEQIKIFGETGQFEQREISNFILNTLNESQP